MPSKGAIQISHGTISTSSRTLSGSARAAHAFWSETLNRIFRAKPALHKAGTDTKLTTIYGFPETSCASKP
jgi:hypothetical protein